MVGMVNEEKESQKQGDYLFHIHTFFIERKNLMRREMGYKIKRGRKEYTCLSPFSTTVQQHNSDAVYFPTLSSGDPITYTCQHKQNLQVIRHKNN